MGWRQDSDQAREWTTRGSNPDRNKTFCCATEVQTGSGHDATAFPEGKAAGA